ncbi:MAG: hypothetical protein ABSD73_07950 [Candidatus Bathyarchaeia archaeon]|jgi:hypothetical protein
MGDSFTGFSQSDFAAFTDSKIENELFNGERKAVWKRMKKLQITLEVELKHRGLFLAEHRKRLNSIAVLLLRSGY